MHCLILLKFGLLVRYAPADIKPRTAGGTCGLKWRCSSNCHQGRINHSGGGHTNVRRTQNFLFWGALFFSKKVDNLF